MRKHAALCQKTIPLGDPNCPEEIELAKKIGCNDIRNKAATGDVNEEFELEEVEFGETTANPNPDAAVAPTRTSASTSQSPRAVLLLKSLPPSHQLSFL